MSLTYPLPPGINIYCHTGKHFINSAPILPCYNTAQVFAKELISSENKQKCTLFASLSIAGNTDLTGQRLVISSHIKSRINLFQN